MRLIMQKRGVLLDMDLQKSARERKQRERMRKTEPEEGVQNGVLVLIMYTGQP